ncbi:MAG: capsule biosynthesis protein, partial [Paracoccaceae bacterium]
PTARAVPPAPTSGPPPAPVDDLPFDTHDDGFGDQVFPGSSKSDAQDAASAVPVDLGIAAALDAIRKEGLTGRQLRVARRLAQRHNFPATSDFDAVRLLRQAGVDPFQRSSMLEMVTADTASDALAPATAPGGGGDQPPVTGRALAPLPGDGVRLPQTVKPIQLPSTEQRAEVNHAAEILKMQQEIAKRRKKKLALLFARLFVFIGLPTLLAAWYFSMVATPLYATKSEFQIQQAAPPAAAGMGGLLSGTSFATSQDSIAVQGYLQSRDAMIRLDQDLGFRAHFQQDRMDPLQRLAKDATLEDAYRVYKKNVHISYDPTEGIIKMEVIAADPQVSAEWSRKLIAYAEEQVDHMTSRLREDAMQGAGESYEQAEKAVIAAQRRVVDLQEKFKVLSSEVEVGLLTTQIGALETQLTQEQLSLAQMQSNETPNKARMDPVQRRIKTLEDQIAIMRAKLTEDGAGGESLARIQGELFVAQADVQTRQMLLGQALTAMETSRIEANRQARYLAPSVSPTPTDEPTYPRAFENTLVTMLILLGIYLMISMTVSILREQVSA